MAKLKGDRLWIGIVIFLVACIVAGGALFFAQREQPAQIVRGTPTPHLPAYGEVFIDGAVLSPGRYPLRADDSLASLIAAAGGLAEDADGVRLELYVPRRDETELPQRVNINTAPVWLLEALPQIGETLAQRIVDYREQNGPFRSTEELTRIRGIGSETYNLVKDKVTVGSFLRERGWLSSSLAPPG